VPFYEFDVLSPRSTPKESPTEVEAGFAAGVVTHVSVQIPRGCAGLVHGEIWRGDFKVWPTNPDGNLKGDAVIIDWDEEYTLEDEPLDLRLRVWNNDDTFPHTLTFRFAVLTLDAAQARQAGPGILSRIAHALTGSG
jgi:hypothetical protein